MHQAFSNIRIPDFTRVLALQDADVVKIEHPDGEDTRNSARSRQCAERKMAPIWMAVNANKRSLIRKRKSSFCGQKEAKKLY